MQEKVQIDKDILFEMAIVTVYSRWNFDDLYRVISLHKREGQLDYIKSWHKAVRQWPESYGR